MDAHTLKIISDKNLNSCMNNTKWNELVSAITSDPNYNPNVIIKYIQEDKITSSFTPVWWEDVKRDGFEIIEWVKIDPIGKEYVGRLVEPSETDYSDFIEQGLKSCNIPFELDNGIYTIYGYKPGN
ncbi:MAG: DUF6678 family protein [Ekhidna sp.]